MFTGGMGKTGKVKGEAPPPPELSPEWKGHGKKKKPKAKPAEKKGDNFTAEQKPKPPPPPPPKAGKIFEGEAWKDPLFGINDKVEDAAKPGSKAPNKAKPKGETKAAGKKGKAKKGKGKKAKGKKAKPKGETKAGAKKPISKGKPKIKSGEAKILFDPGMVRYMSHKSKAEQEAYIQSQPPYLQAQIRMELEKMSEE